MNKIDLVEVVRREGFELIQRSSRFVGLCPFHLEKTPSFNVFRDGRYYCFGCHESGDAIDFVRTLYGLNFHEALEFLGINNRYSSSQTRKAITDSMSSARVVKTRIQRERDLINTLAILIRSTYKIMADIKTIQQLEHSGDIMQPLAWWEYCHDMLAHGTKEEKDLVVEALKDMTTISRHYLWSIQFNYRQWLRNFLNGVPHERCNRIKISIS